MPHFFLIWVRFEITVLCHPDKVEDGCVWRGMGCQIGLGWGDEVSGVAGVHIGLMDLLMGIDGGP